ncbi:MAG: T9SS type A sorting domain-containing protein [Bacteroidetes bacterium]|nr:T9SS type A sorting domain-containing protein [Bacteroidota bacterium]
MKDELFSKSFDAISKFSEFFSSKIMSDNDNQTYVPPSVIHEEMAMIGQLREEVPSGATTIYIANPGSLNSNNKPEYNDGVPPRPVPMDVDYPIYNEVLGTFALLESPYIISYHTASDLPFCRDENGLPTISQYTDSFQIASDIKYVFNPALNIDIDKTTIKAAIILKVNEGIPSCEEAKYNIDYSDLSPDNLEFISEATKNGITTDKYISPFIPIDRLNSFSAGISGVGYYVQKIYVRFSIHMVSKNLDKNGKPNQSVFVATYEVPQQNIFGKDISPDQFMSSAKDLILQSNNDLWTLNASNSITINGSISNSTSSNLFLASPSIQINSGGSIGSNITLVSKQSNEGIPVPPQTQAYVASFCDAQNASYKYKANTFAVDRQLQYKYVENLSKIKFSDSERYEPTAYPNPAQGNVNFQYYVEQPSNVKLAITDLTGRTVSVVVEGFQEAGPYNVDFETTSLPVGVYIYTLETSKGKESKRLVIVK